MGHAEQVTSAMEICWKLGVGETAFYAWKKKYVGMGVAGLQRVKQLVEENRPVKRLVATTGY